MKHYLPALTIASLALVGFAVFFLTVADKTQAQPQQTSPYYIAREAQTLHENSQTELPSSSSPLGATSNYRVVISVLDHDQDHDGNYDGISDPLGALVVILVVPSMWFILHPLVGGRLLLAFCESQKFSSFGLRFWSAPDNLFRKGLLTSKAGRVVVGAPRG